MSTGTIRIIPSLNKSKVIFENGHWIIYGSHNILAEQEPDEFAYKIKADIRKLDLQIPIYANVNAFLNTNNNIEDGLYCYQYSKSLC